MDCKDAEKRINNYINGSLSPKETEAFLNHIRTCPACYDELETYYTIRVAMGYTEAVDDTYNIKDMLEADMQQKRAYIQKIRRRKITFFIITLLGYLSLFDILLLKSSFRILQSLLLKIIDWLIFQ